MTDATGWQEVRGPEDLADRMVWIVYGEQDRPRMADRLSLEIWKIRQSGDGLPTHYALCEPPPWPPVKEYSRHNWPWAAMADWGKCSRCGVSRQWVLGGGLRYRDANGNPISKPGKCRSGR